MNEKATILVVDDQEDVREFFRVVLKKLGYSPHVVDGGRAALASIAKSPPDLVVMDMWMPDMDGLKVLSSLKSDPLSHHIPVIMVSGDEERSTALKCIEMGADDYLPKPCPIDLIEARVNGCLRKKRINDRELAYRDSIESHNNELKGQIEQQTEETEKAQLATIFALSKLAESRDPETGEHLERMREYCRILCETLKHDSRYSDVVDATFVDNVYAASPLHDVGKVGIPDAVLLKKGKLNDSEFEIIKTHARIGSDTLQAVDDEYPGNDLVHFGIEIARSHHEKWDGSGYPDGLSGEDIPLPARILAVGDVYDALTSARCYKKAFSHEKSREIILEGRATHFDPELVDAFIANEPRLHEVRRRYADLDASL